MGEISTFKVTSAKKMIISENEVLKRQFKNDLLNGNVVPHSSVIQFLCFNPKKFKLIFSLRPGSGWKG